MNIFGFSVQKIPVVPQVTKRDNGYFISDLGVYTIDGKIDVNTVEGKYLAYCINPVVRHIVDKRAEALTNLLYTIEDSKGIESTSEDANQLRAVLKSPNSYTTRNEFIKQISISLDLYGEAFIVPIYLMRSKVQGFFVLPLQYSYIEMDYTNYPMSVSRNNYIKEIYYNLNGKKIDLTPIKDKIIIIRQSYDENKPNRGLSRLPSIQNEINKLNIASIAQMDLLSNYGALGFLSSNTKDGLGVGTMNPNQKKSFEDDYTQKYGLTFDKKKIILTSLDLKHVSMSLPLKDLMLDETTISASKMICDTIGYKFNLLAFSNQQTYNNILEDKKSLYTEIIYPTGTLIYNSFEAFLSPTEKISVYFDSMEFMKKSEKEKAETDKIKVDTVISMVQGGLMTNAEAITYLIDNEIIKK